MLVSSSRPSPLSPSIAVLLTGESLSVEERALAAVLEQFGIPWKRARVEDIAASEFRNRQFAILSSAPVLADALSRCEPTNGFAHWFSTAHSVFVYGFQNTEPCTVLLRFLTDDPQAQLTLLAKPRTTFSIKPMMPELCGPMSGLTVSAETPQRDSLFQVQSDGERVRPVISSTEGQLFLAVQRHSLRFYLTPWSRIVDIHAPCPKFFDIRQCFCAAAPVVMYLKSVFQNTGWKTPGTSACLIVDDPLLTPRYGFLRYDEAVRLMDRHNFTTAIGFIPWNWSRSNPRTVDLFQTRPDRLSLCIHGSDHTRSEFATRSSAQLSHAINTASQRMASFQRRSALPHARVMVFPQGAFSPEAGRALKLSGFVAAVNTEVAPLDPSSGDTTIADVWNLAILKYGTFPIFTRRYTWHGIENFAFDGLLGKPCFVVGHHDTFKNHGRGLVDFISRLNALSWDLHWRPLDDALRRSYRFREMPDGTQTIQMFAHTALIENPAAQTRRAASRP